MSSPRCVHRNVYWRIYTKVGMFEDNIMAGFVIHHPAKANKETSRWLYFTEEHTKLGLLVSLLQLIAYLPS